MLNPFDLHLISRDYSELSNKACITNGCRKFLCGKGMVIDYAEDFLAAPILTTLNTLPLHHWPRRCN
ncbi:hypothetical protein J3L11_08680 [Shewanella sp. 4t3-1-2LB]|uniref:hypothetical protein n=1 Tax=Shewanella sp. 4t3-1-2LB TaxID=2817682 RepID=UPI001A984A17|nr:hypothetical protein [Shewanella sp. 4t3-1-2LB]MBO1271714.1 hypothetical protein [Shewanella sp. 4t3-1-2LB]